MNTVRISQHLWGFFLSGLFCQSNHFVLAQCLRVALICTAFFMTMYVSFWFLRKTHSCGDRVKMRESKNTSSPGEKTKQTFAHLQLHTAIGCVYELLMLRWLV